MPMQRKPPQRQAPQAKAPPAQRNAGQRGTIARVMGAMGLRMRQPGEPNPVAEAFQRGVARAVLPPGRPTSARSKPPAARSKPPAAGRSGGGMFR
jgi:hypothetical protein